jgi:hypothetical protein
VTIGDFTGVQPVERTAHRLELLRSSVLTDLHASAFGLFA